MATIRCQVCKTLRETRTNDRSTWPCPVCEPAPAPAARFTVDPRGARGFGRRNTGRIDR